MNSTHFNERRQQKPYMNPAHLQLIPATQFTTYTPLAFYPIPPQMLALPPPDFVYIQQRAPSPQITSSHAQAFTLPPPKTYPDTEQIAQEKWSDKSGKEKYKCSKCECTYFSYPALYTHNKLKHVGGDQVRQKSNRGRPRKNKVNARVNFLQGTESERQVNPLKFVKTKETKEKCRTVLYGFEEAFLTACGNTEEYKRYQDHPLYKELERVTAVKQDQEESKNPDNWCDMENMLERRKKSCDEVFAEYLLAVSRVACEAYYVKVLKFVLLYRECLNLFGGKLAEEKKKLPSVLDFNTATAEGSSADYCVHNNAEQIPDISNEFMKVYLPKACPQFAFDEAKKLTLSLCHWLFASGYTCSLLSTV